MNAMSSRAQEIPDRVEFRWREHERPFAELLAAACRKSDRSPSEQARETLKDALTASDRLQHAVESLQEEVAQLHHQLRNLATIKEGVRNVYDNVYELRDDLAACIIKLLTDVGHLDATSAANWVRNTFDAE